jgi:hypothetical protein
VTWVQGLWAVDGNTLDASLWRQELYAGTLKRSGIMAPTDLKVTAFSTPGAGVNVAGGSCVIAGQELSGGQQGSYYGFNNGTDTVAVSATGGSARSDLIIARVEDPTFSGSPWSWNPATQNLIYSRDLSGVAGGTTTVPAGTTGIPLARIDIPSSTTNITNAMITDLRALANPARETDLYVLTPTSTDTMNASTDSKTTMRNWGPAFPSVYIPTWAVTMRVMFTVAASAVGGSSYGCAIVMQIKVGSSITSQVGGMGDPGVGAILAGFQSVGMLGDNINVSSLQGQTVTVQPQARIANTVNVQGTISINSSSTETLMCHFLEAPQ